MSARPNLTIGTLGLGRMGAPIRDRLVGAGFTVTSFDPADSACTTSAAGVAALADVLLTVLPGPRELEAAMSEAIPLMQPSSVWLDLTSGDPILAERLSAQARQRGIASVGAPMGGGPADAAAGTLTLFVDGADDDVDTVRPILSVLASRILRIGTEAGQGQTVKLLANLLWFGQVAAATEALLLGQALGLDPVALRDTLAVSAGGSRFIESSTDSLFRGDYLTSFGLGRVLEELETLERLARETGTPFSLSRDVTQLYRDAVAEFGEVDGEMLVAKLLEQRAGRLLRDSRER